MDREKRGRRGGAGKKRSKAGETLTETLVTMLIVGLSSVLFLTMVGAAGRIFRKAETDYDRLYGEITLADNKKPADVLSSDNIGKIVIGEENKKLDVNWYGSKDYVLSYEVSG